MRTELKRSALVVSLALLPALSACAEDDGLRGPDDLPISARRALTDLSPAELPGPPADSTNAFAEDPAAAALGKKFFHETRFSGPLLDESNNGLSGTLGAMGETGKVSCSGCHVPSSGFLDTRSPRAQISLGSGWTHRRAPSLLNVGQVRFLMWDGRHDTFYSQPFTPLEDPSEFNSSRLFVAQQIVRLYRDEYEAVFGPLPSLDQYEPLAALDAGCSELPTDTAHGGCAKPGQDDEDVTRIVANMGKAIQAYTRQIKCGRSRFDRWMDGNDAALNADEKAGALLFVGKAHCNSCHHGPYFSDQRFHNVGMIPDYSFFIDTIEDPGAAEGLARMLEDPLNSKGSFSDGYDGRQERLQPLDDRLLGAFRTPSLRCVSRRPSFMHTGQFRALNDVVLFFDRGGDPPQGYLGQSENYPRGLSSKERAELVAFLKALDGDGPDPELVMPPELPPEPAG